MKKIALAVTNDLVSDQRVHKVASALHQMGWDVNLIGRVFKFSGQIHRPYKVFRFFLFFQKGPLFYAFYNIRLFFYLIFSKFDCILANDLDTLPACWLASRLKRCPLVVDYHELFTEVPELIERKFQRGVWLFFEKMALPSAKAIYTVSQPIADELTKRYGMPVVLVRNVPFYVGSELPAPKLNFEEKKIILYQGSLNVGRGLERAIEVMKHLSNAVLVIIGTGDVEHHLKDWARMLGVSDKVVFVGRVPFEELLPYTVSAHIGLSIEEDRGLNYRYALPNKVFDYVQAGVPVVVTALPEMKKIVEKYQIGRVCEVPGSLPLAKLLQEMLNDLEALKIFREKTLLAAKELCWEEEQNGLKAIFSKIANKC